MSFRCSPAVKEPVDTLCRTPWKIAVKPFQVSPRTYYMSGQKWVGTYLIDTGDGLILIDTGIAESLYLLIDSICALGYRPSDIRLILLSHAHQDHIGGAAALHELTGAPVYLSREDEKFLRECPEETELPDSEPWHVQHIRVDKNYDGDIVLGDIRIHPVLTPGHTIGCTSFFWEEINPLDGSRYTVAMHGGVGANTMNDDYYRKSHYLRPYLRDRFLADAKKIRNIHVDIALPSHPNQIEIMDRAGTYSDASQPYVDDTVWPAFIDERVRQVRALMTKTQELKPCSGFRK